MSQSATSFADLKLDINMPDSSLVGESLHDADMSVLSINGGGAGLSVKGDTIDDVVSGVSVILIKNYGAICGGAIGYSKMGCALGLACTTAKHRTKKIIWPTAEPAFYLMNKASSGKPSCYLDPFLPLASVAQPAEITRLLQDKFTPESWAEKVGDYEFALKTGTSAHLARSEVMAIKDAFKTPARTNKRQVDFEKSLAYLGTTASKMPKLEDGGLLTSFEETIQELKVARSSDGVATVSTNDLLPMLVELARRVDSQASLDASQSEFAEASSQFMKSEFADVNLMLGALSGDMATLKSLVGSRSEAFENQGNIFEILSSFLDTFKMSGVQASVERKSALVRMEEFITTLLPYRSSIEQCFRRLDTLENGHVGGRGGQDASPIDLHRAPRAPTPVNLPRDRTWEKQIEKELAEVKKIAAGQSGAGDKGVSFGGKIFANQDEFGAWITKNEGRNSVPISLFQNHVTLLHLVHLQMSGSLRELRDAKVMSDLDLKEADVHASQAMSMGGLPMFFKGDKSTQIFTGMSTGGPKHRFKGIQSFARWGEPGDTDCYRAKALEALEKVERTLSHDIEADLMSSEVKTFASKMLARSVSFVSKLFTYMSNTYQDFMKSFGDADQTWDFVCLCVEKILTVEFSEAKSLACGMNFHSTNFGPRMLWCSVKVVAVQETFLEIGIANHPILSATCSRFLIKNGNKGGDLEPTKKKVNSNTELLAALEASVKELTSQVKSAHSAADKATSTVKKLEKELAAKKK